MIVQVALFAAAREAVDANEISVELAEPFTVSMLKTAMAEQYESLSEIIPRSAISVDHEYATDIVTINLQSEVALIPPVSGG